jgi:hypothetical protein
MNKEKSTTQSKIESELFSIIKTILNLNNKHKKGIIKEEFFQKSLKNALNELLKLNFSLKDNDINLNELLTLMGLTGEYHDAIDIINYASSLKFPSNSYSSQESPSRIRKSILSVPKLTLEITSSFITLMDALKLSEFDNFTILTDLFEDLAINLKQFPGLESIKVKLDKIRAKIDENQKTLMRNQKYREFLANELYELFKSFQNSLDL